MDIGRDNWQGDEAERKLKPHLTTTEEITDEAKAFGLGSGRLESSVALEEDGG